MILSGFIWSLVEKIVQLGFQFIAIVYFSHILPPSDFGVVAVLSVFLMLSNVIVDSGIVGAVIKKQDTTDLDFHTLFCFNLFTSIILYTILFVLAPTMESIYEIENLALYIRVSSVAILFNSLGLVHFAILTKEMRFKKQAMITFFAQLLTIAVSLIVARLGLGVWALISLHVSLSIINSFLLNLLSKYRPKIKFSISIFKEHFSFGGPLLLTNILYSINNNLFNTFLPKWQGLTNTGFFSQSLRLKDVPVGVLASVVDKVAFTVLTKKTTTDEMIISAIQLNRAIYKIVLPIIVLIIFFSENIFALMFGSQWFGAVEVFGVISLSLIPIFVRVMNRNILKSLGHTKNILMIELVASGAFLSCLFTTMDMNLVEVGYGYLVANIIITLFSISIIGMRTKYKITNQLIDFSVPVIFAFFVLYAFDYLAQYFFSPETFTKTLFICFGFFITYLAFLSKLIATQFKNMT